jgi:hypothetical protein
MVTLVFATYFFILFFGLIGMLRGWTKEVMVSTSVVLALAFITVIEDLLPFTKDFIGDGSSTQFWVRSAIFVIVVFFGYHSSRLAPRLAGDNGKSGQLQNFILGGLFGALNGFMIFTTIWYFMDFAGYPLAPNIVAPSYDTATAETAQRLLNASPPVLLQGVWLWVALIVAVFFVMVAII